jgi:hypothetical protein
MTRLEQFILGIPGDVRLSFRDFEVFYEARKWRLSERFASLLKGDIAGLQSSGTLGSNNRFEKGRE